MPRAVRLAALFAVCALAAVAAGCGGGGSSDTTTTTASATQWANDFCGAFADWKQEADSIVAQFDNLSSLSKDNLQNAANALNTATDQLLEDLKNLGAPDTQSGQEIKDSVDQLSTTIQTQTDAIKKTIDDTSGIAEVPAAVSDVIASVNTMATAVSSTTSTIQNSDAQGELKDAITSSSDCQNLTK